MIPLYTYPGSTWTQTEQVKSSYPGVPVVAIINPNNGPGSSSDSNYVSGVQQLQAAGVVVLGYVHTSYGSRSTSTLESEINEYKNWYHVNGIFFDEMANTAGYQTYYSNLSSYVKSNGMTMTVGNPGTSTISSYVSTMDNLIIYENPGLPALSDLASYTFNGAYSKSHFSYIAYGVSLPALSYVTSSAAYVSYVYITNDGGSNPYDTLPSYLTSEVADLNTIGGGVTTTVPSAPSGLAATAASSSQIDLSWNAPSSNGGSVITGYKVDRSANGGSTWSNVAANTGSTNTSYSNTGLAASTSYTYRVEAINAAGTGPSSNTASTTTQASSGGSSSGGGSTSGGIVLTNGKSTWGTVSSAGTITLSSFAAGSGSGSLLVVGISTNNNPVSSVTFGGVPLTRAVSSFYNNDAEFWYLKNPTGTANIAVTMAGSTSAVIGAYSFTGVDLTNPMPTHVAKHNTSANSPNITITTKYANDLVLDLPSIWGGVTLGSPTCTQGWNHNISGAITGASSSELVSSPSSTTCRWTASSGDQWDDVAVEIKAG